MNTAAPQTLRPHHPCESLVFALRTIARGGGYMVDHDDLAVAMGLPWLTCAVQTEPDVGLWPMYARDVFLVEAGRLFGLTIRGIHPPEAARGLDGAAEFRQHFDASYRPLIQRALEHDQPVLAWRGWPGDRAAHWGVIKTACEAGGGFAGVTMTSPDDGVAENMIVLDRPPIQLYVVEAIAPTVPTHNDVFDMAVEHARTILNGELRERFGVVTGPAAYDGWIARLGGPPSPPVQSATVTGGHRRLAASVRAGHQSAVRFLSRCADGRPPAGQPLVETLLACSGEVVAALEASSDEEAAAAPTSATGRVQWSRRLGRARAAITNAMTALQAYEQGKRRR